MKKLFLVSTLLVAFLLSSFSAYAVVSVRGYYRSNGTYVAPHYRSNPDGNVYNNWSTKGNVNPYTGKAGTKTYPSPSSGTAINNLGSLNNTSTTKSLKPLSTLSNINKEINTVKWKYQANHDGFRERLIKQITDYLGAPESQVADQVYATLLDIK
jgi:hypothetical protein